MIISASRRTDIPNYYYEWFTNRLKERFVLVRNPMNHSQISKIDLSPEVVDCIVFWTKNPESMLNRLESLQDYNYYVQFTVTSYGRDIEPGVPSKWDKVLEAFKRLSEKIGPEKVIWRYDPILLTKAYSMQYHMEYFEKTAQQLAPFTEKCVFSFMDYYVSIRTNLKEIGAWAPDEREQLELSKAFQSIACQYGLLLETCAENIDLSHMGIHHGKCIDPALIERIAGCPVTCLKDKNQRLECGCIESIDIGTYNTCSNGCRYCYASHSRVTLKQNIENYNVNCPILCSRVHENDKINLRKVESFKGAQLTIKL